MATEPVIQIRPAVQDDLSAIRHLLISAFRHTFDADNDPENMEHYIRTAYAYDQLLREFQEPGNAFYVALDGERLAGVLQLRVNHEAEEHLGRNTLELQRIYVLPAYLGARVGKALMETALQHAQSAKVTWLWLGVWEKNHHAQKFYERWGFEKFSEHIFAMKDDQQTDWLMRKRIV